MEREKVESSFAFVGFKSPFSYNLGRFFLLLCYCDFTVELNGWMSSWDGDFWPFKSTGTHSFQLHRLLGIHPYAKVFYFISLLLLLILNKVNVILRNLTNMQGNKNYYILIGPPTIPVKIFFLSKLT
jgi:hypothetical protein